MQGSRTSPSCSPAIPRAATSYVRELDAHDRLARASRASCGASAIAPTCRPPSSAASVVTVPSTEPEAFGRSAVEAQAMGTPVVVSDLGAVPETVLAPPQVAAARADRLARPAGRRRRARRGDRRRARRSAPARARRWRCGRASMWSAISRSSAWSPTRSTSMPRCSKGSAGPPHVEDNAEGSLSQLCLTLVAS